MLNEIFIAKQNLKSKNKNKIGLPPNKRYCLTPLARHKTRIYLCITMFGMQSMLGNIVISKKILRTRKIMVMHSNER